jgi:glutaredoxin-related protein
MPCSIQVGERAMDLTEVTIIVLISNMIVNCVLAALYFYRVEIEKKQVDIMVKNAEAKAYLDAIRKHIHTERKDIENMSKEDLKEFLDYLEHVGE